MGELLAGFGRAEITPHHLGQRLIGYSARSGPATGVHDPLWARAVILRQGTAAWALCTLDVCLIPPAITAEVRRIVAQRTDLQPQQIAVIASHTHSAPLLIDPANWDAPVATLIAQAITDAWTSAEPARLAAGAGLLYGQSINRRWLDRPIDPAVGVLRVDASAGHLLGTLINYACHPVVLGADNLLISADYVGYATSMVERELGGVCLFTNGGCGDVNPLTATVRRARAEGRPIITMVPGVRYYGDRPDALHIGDRAGGSFAEAEEIGTALGHEVLAVARGLQPSAPERQPWSTQVFVNHLDDGEELIEAQALGVGAFALAAYPGEVFGESALAVKAGLRALGYPQAWLVSYANDWQGYMAPAAAFPEGGYEADSARAERHSPQLHDRLWAGLSSAIEHVAHRPQRAGASIRPLSRWGIDADTANQI